LDEIKNDVSKGLLFSFLRDPDDFSMEKVPNDTMKWEAHDTLGFLSVCYQESIEQEKGRNLI
jgi:hypothetical protein